MQQNLPLAPTHLAPCACGRHANLTKMGPRARGETLGKVCAPSSVHRVRRLREPLAVRLPHDGLLGAALQADQGRQSRAKAVDEIEIFEGNLAQLREIEMAELSSEDEEESD